MDPDPYNFPGSEAVMNPHPDPHKNYSYPGLQDIFTQKEHTGIFLIFIKLGVVYNLFKKT